MVQGKNEPIQSGPMYIGICATRAQAIAQRWQGVIVFITVNAGLTNILGSIFYIERASQVLKMLAVLIIATLFNYAWFKLVERSNRWIDFYTERLREIENHSGTESGVSIFSSPEYPSIKVGKGEMRSSSGIRTIIQVALYSNITFDICAFLYVIYLLGQGRW